MTPERPWARHYMDVWHERAGDPQLPLWLRAASLAYGSHDDNGHASFKRGHVALVLGRPGEPHQNVGRAIDMAVELGWLAEGSWYGCLIVPRSNVWKGPWGHPKPCRRCAARNANSSPSELQGFRSSTPSELFVARTARPVSFSEREPLSLCSAPEASASAPTTARNGTTP